MLETSIRQPARLASNARAGQTATVSTLVLQDTDTQALRQQFDTIWAGFNRHGGVWDVHDVERRMRMSIRQPISTLAHLIVARRIVTFGWGGAAWFPAFQFQSESMSLSAESQYVLAELAPVYDDFEVAHWLTSPNVLLGGAAPVDRIGDHPCCVLAAARLDRFVAKG